MMFPLKDGESELPVTVEWAVIQSAKFQELTTPLVRKKVRQGNLTQMMNQAAGLTVSIAALGDHSDLDSTLQWSVTGSKIV